MKTHKAQLYDNIHSVINSYNDRMVRGIFEYDFVINTDVLSKVLRDFLDTSPVMHSMFKRGFISHRWIEQPIDEKDFLKVIHTDNPFEDASCFITKVLPMNEGVQLKLGVFTNGHQTALAVITNHMYMDGGDLKYFMKALCKAYNACAKGEETDNILKSGSRSYKTVYKDLTPKNKRKARLLYSNPTPKNTKSFPLTDAKSKDKSFIITRNISEDKFLLIKKYGKQFDATVNDMILTAYFMSLYVLGNFEKNESVTVSGAIDLRRYINNSELTGLTNHSSYLPYTLDCVEADFLKNLKKVTKISQKYKADPFTGLYGLPLLNFGYRFFPSWISDKLVKRFYNNPNIAMSNIGILYENLYALEGFAPRSAFLTGTVKYKPGIMVSLTTYRNKITLSMCCKGSDEDKTKLQNLLMLIEQNLTEAIKKHPES